MAEAFASAGISVSISLLAANRIAPAVREAMACGVEAVAVGGGDGTLGAAAGVLSGGRVPLGVLPLGTRNHFARDLGIPADLGAAARTIAAGRTSVIDVGEVNGRVFLNNSSIGLYPELVEGREALRSSTGASSWPATLRSALGVLHRFSRLRVTLQAAGERRSLRTPFVFVGNNAYELRLLELGRRRALDRGELIVYVARHETRLSLLRLALLGMAGRLEQDRDFKSLVVADLEIAARRPWLRVGVDGEVARMAPPVRYRILPRALQVFVPGEP